MALHVTALNKLSKLILRIVTNKNSDKNLIPNINVLERSLYREQLLLLPIVDKKMVRQAIEFELNNSKDEAVYFIGGVENNQTQVVIYWTNDGVINNSGVWIPESLVLGIGASKNTVIKYYCQGIPVYLYNNGSYTVSNIASGLFKDVEYFCASHGLPNLDVTVLSEEVVTSSIRNQWFKIPWFQCLGLFKRFSGEQRDLFDSFTKILIPFTVFFTVYLAASHTWTSSYVTSLRSELSEVQSEVGESLSLRSEVRSLDKTNSELFLVEDLVKTRWEIWPAIIPLYEMGSQIERLSIDGDKVTLRVRSASSSDILESLLANKWVKSAKFDGAARKIRDLEVVNIELLLNAEIQP